MMHGTGVTLPFVFIPDGAEAPAAWRAAHPDAVRIPARLVLRGGVQRVQFVVRGRRLPGFGGAPPARPPDFSRWMRELFGWTLETRRDDSGKAPDPRTHRPVDAPRGTRPIDQAGLSTDDVHDVKGEIRAGPDDWVGIDPDGNVIVPGAQGEAINLGPWQDYVDRGTGGGWRNERRKSRGRGKSGNDNKR